MPIPQGDITTTEIWNTPAEPPLPEDPTEVEQQEEVREDDLQ
jgi:hypothetical protein